LAVGQRPSKTRAALPFQHSGQVSLYGTVCCSVCCIVLCCVLHCIVVCVAVGQRPYKIWAALAFQHSGQVSENVECILVHLHYCTLSDVLASLQRCVAVSQRLKLLHFDIPVRSVSVLRFDAVCCSVLQCVTVYVAVGQRPCQIGAVLVFKHTRAHIYSQTSTQNPSLLHEVKCLSFV